AQFEQDDVFGTILVEPLHGAASRVPPDATAFAGREASYNVTFIGAWQDPGADAGNIARARGYSSALAPWAIGGGYINYASEAAGGEVRVLGRRIDRTQSPEGEGPHDGLQSLAVRRQLVDPGSRRRIEPTLAQQPARLQVLEPSREDVGADPRQAGREVGVAL